LRQKWPSALNVDASHDYCSEDRSATGPQTANLGDPDHEAGRQNEQHFQRRAIVSQARTIDVNVVRQAMYGQRLRTPSGFEVVMNTNDHLSKPALVGKLDTRGTFDVV
jgi:Periplasmic binding protein domain